MESNQMNEQDNKSKELTSRQKLSILNQWDTYMKEIFPTHNLIEKSIYIHLFWLTIGTGTRECQISYAEIRKVTGIKADLTICKHIDMLIEKRHLKLIKRVFNTPSIYRVYSPLEIITPDKHDKKKSSKAPSDAPLSS